MRTNHWGRQTRTTAQEQRTGTLDQITPTNQGVEGFLAAFQRRFNPAPQFANNRAGRRAQAVAQRLFDKENTK